MAIPAIMRGRSRHGLRAHSFQMIGAPLTRRIGSSTTITSADSSVGGGVPTGKAGGVAGSGGGTRAPADAIAGATSASSPTGTGGSAAIWRSTWAKAACI